MGMGQGVEGREEQVKIIEIHYVQVPAPHNGHNHYILEKIIHQNIFLKILFKNI